MMTFDKLGEFYLGKRVDDATTPVLLAAEDLTTHAFIVGMTGSGKTGLAIDLLEEALIDDVPVIAIDPKGDLSNLALQFADLQSSEASQWLDADAKAHWEKLRNDSGLTDARIQNLADKLSVQVFTPGNSDGLPVNTLPLGIDANSRDTQQSLDKRLEERANAMSIALLNRIGEYKEASASPAQVYLAQIMLWHWRQGQSLSLTSLLTAVQRPPFDTVGMLDVSVFFPEDDRHDLMLKLNTLIAAPGFDDWLSGPALDVGAMYAMGEAKVPVTIFSIAHLSDQDRQFFVQLLLAEIISWMRQQPGSSSLRAMLYMDEIYGYIPPVANPPSKSMFLTLLKQARAYGLGLTLATQNPVDLDYKGLSNIGTWMIGRLQTKGDRDRLMDGLDQLRDSDQNIDDTIANLDKRQFLLHSVHREAQCVFYTRCTQALLVGPMSIDQIKSIPNLVAPQQPNNTPTSTKTDTAAHSPTVDQSTKAQQAASSDASHANMADLDSNTTAAESMPSPTPPAVNPRIQVLYHQQPANNAYQPRFAARLSIYFEDEDSGLSEFRQCTLLVPTSTADQLSWDQAELLSGHGAAVWAETPRESVAFADLPRSLNQLDLYQSNKTMIRKATESLAETCLREYKPLELVASPDESEQAFRTRVAQAIKNNRDVLKAQLREESAAAMEALNEDLVSLENKLAEEKSQSLAAKVNTVAKIGSALLSVFLSTKKVSVTNANRAGSSINAIGRARKQAQDVDLIEEKIDRILAEKEKLEAELADKIHQLENEQPNLQSLAITERTIKPKHTDIDVAQTLLLWV